MYNCPNQWSAPKSFSSKMKKPTLKPAKWQKNFCINTSCLNWTRAQNHLVLKRTLNHLTKWLSVHLRTKWFWVRVQLQSLYLQILRLL